MADNEQTEIEIPEPTDDEQNWIKILRNKAKERDQFATQLAEAKRRDAIRDAGLNPEQKLHKLLIDGYKGEWEADALKTAANEYGLFEEQRHEPSQEELAEQAAHQRINESSQGASSGSGSQEPQPWLDATDPEEFMAQYKGRVWME